MQSNISYSVALYIESVSFKLFEKYPTRCQILPCYCSKTAPTVLADASDLTCTGCSGSYILRTEADAKANFSASKAACYSAPNLNDILPYKISLRGAATLANL